MAKRPETPPDDDFGDLNFDDDLFGDDDKDTDFLRGGLGGDDSGDEEFDFDAADAPQDQGDFGFDDELGDFGDDEDADFGGLDDIEDDFLTEGEEEAATPTGGPNRTFVLLAIAMIAMFVIGLIAVLFLALSPKPPSDFDLSVTAVIALNATTQKNATETADAATAQVGTQAVLDATQTAVIQAQLAQQTGVAQTQTQEAINAGATLTATFLTPAPTIPVTFDETQIAATQFAANQTATALASQQITPTEVAGLATVPGAGLTAVALTATALAQIFNDTPTPQVAVSPVGGGTPSVRPTALPDGGFLDDVFSGGREGFGAMFLVAVGLLGVIVASRRLRVSNR